MNEKEWLENEKKKIERAIGGLFKIYNMYGYRSHTNYCFWIEGEFEGECVEFVIDIDVQENEEAYRKVIKNELKNLFKNILKKVEE